MNSYNYLNRILDLKPLLQDRSCFLFGPRQSGKSSYVQKQLFEKPALSINLLNEKIYFEYLRNPGHLIEICQARSDLKENDLIFIDEIQRIPSLLNDIHLLIEKNKLRFIMTCSSARSLREKGVNLLGGRARTRVFHGFVYPEIPDCDLEKVFYCGTLPPHYLSSMPDEDLSSYLGTFLNQEIFMDSKANSLGSFSRFLEVAACCNGQMLNYTSIGNDAGLKRHTVQGYFQTLINTFIGYELEAYRKTVKRKACETSKFYLFDLGIVRVLKRLGHIVPGSADFGFFFEHFIFLELKAFNDYFFPLASLHYWRSLKGQEEVDFIWNEQWAIEIKSKEHVKKEDYIQLLKLQEEKLFKKFIVVSREKSTRYLKEENVWIYNWQEFLTELWAQNGKLWD